MRTLVISDLHIAQAGGISVLEQPRPLGILLEELRQYDRLVLLGDTVELQDLPASRAFPIAEPILRAIGEAVGSGRAVSDAVGSRRAISGAPGSRRAISGAPGSGRPIVLVPGNHDHVLVRNWAAAQGDSLERDAVVPPQASPELAQIVSWLGSERVEVRYPGVWLTDRIWAAHGHHLNFYLRPVSSVGVLHPRRRQHPAELSLPSAYEHIPGSLSRQRVRDGLPASRWHDHLVSRRLAPVVSRVLDVQMRRHGLPAMAHVAHALEVDADYVIFGHVHRLGPLAHDESSQWLGLDGAQQLINTGCWRFEPIICQGRLTSHSYWPGGAVTIEADGVPRPVNLLADLSERDFTHPATASAIR